MIYGNYDFVDLDYKPTSKDMIMVYKVTPIKGMSLKVVAEYLAGESSIGTWTKIQTMNEKLAKKLKPHVFEINSRKKIIKVAYHEDLFEKGNIPGLLSSIAGNIYGMKEIEKLKLLDIKFTKSFVKSFKGPQLGIDGLYKLMNFKKRRPLLGTIVKPKVGLTSWQHAKVAYDAWIGGLDIVKDDENLTSLDFNTFKKRVTLTITAMKKAESETNSKKIYLPNVTAETNEMLKRASLIKKLGGNYVMVDVLTVGWAGVQTLREHCKKLNLAIHGHRAMHGVFTKLPDHGISMLVIAKLCRLIGIDTLHIGTCAIGKMGGDTKKTLELEREISSLRFIPKDLDYLSQDWYSLKKVMPVASGGLHPGLIPKLYKLMGPNLVMQFGGGCHGHPKGTRAGAMAICQSLNATLNNISLKTACEQSDELRLAGKTWGFYKERTNSKLSYKNSNKKQTTFKLSKTKIVSDRKSKRG